MGGTEALLKRPLMSISIRSLGLDELPVEDKISLIDQLWEDVIARDKVVPISDELAEELKKRLADYRANPENSYTPEQVREAALKNIGK